MEKKMNTTIDFEFCDGTTTKLTLTYYMLYQLKNKNKSLYTRYNEAMNRLSKQNMDELDTITILYTAYACANMENGELMSEIEFMQLCGSDRKAVGRAVKELTQPKKQ